MEFTFILKNQPTEELIEEFHDGIAKDLIQNLGIEMMKEVVKRLEEQAE